MKIRTLFFSIFIAVILPSYTRCMLKNIEDKVINFAETLYEKIEEMFKVKNEKLFHTQKPLTITQFPQKSNSAITNQTHETAKELRKILEKSGMSFDNVKNATLYFTEVKDGIRALKILKDKYPQLAQKITLYKWDGKMPDSKYKMFIVAQTQATTKKDTIAKL